MNRTPISHKEQVKTTTMVVNLKQSKNRCGVNKPQEYFNDFCSKKGLKKSKQREKVVNTFLQTERHIGSFELYDIIRKQDKKIGYSTVYRTLKLLTEAGLAQALDMGYETRFEHKLGHKHHDHFLCNKCGKTVEFTSPSIERIQDNLARKYKFSPQKHSLIIYGTCAKCKK